MIPRAIQHVWPGDDPFRREFHPYRAGWLAHHPDWTLRFWRTDLGPGAADEVCDLLADPRYSVVVKSDLARYEILRLHGGVYVDTDVECLRPFDSLLEPGFFCGRETDDFLCPSVIGSVPGHPLTALLVQEALSRIHEAGPERANASPNEISGPFLLTELARDRADIVIHPREHFYPIGWWETHRLEESAPGAYAKHRWHGTRPDGWTHEPLVDAPRPAAPRYDLGGVTPRPGYVTVNLAAGADVRCDILELDRLHPADGEVEAFLLEHTLEHIPVLRYQTFLRDLHRKLRSGGSVVVVQTDADVVIRDYAAGRLSFRSMRSTLFTPADRLRSNPLHLHQNMWSAAELARDFRAVGFEAATFDAGSWSFDMWDPFHDADLRRDHGKPIRNLGVRAIKR